MKFKVYDTKYLQIGVDAIKLIPNTIYDILQFPEHLRRAIEYIITKNPTQFEIIKNVEILKPKVEEIVLDKEPIEEPIIEEEIEIEEIPAEEPVIEEEIIVEEKEPEIDFENMTKQVLIDFILERSGDYTKSQLNKLKVQEVREIAKSL